MSQFSSLSRKIGSVVHRTTKDTEGTTDQRTDQVLEDEELRQAVKDLVKYTIKMTEGNNE